MNRGDEFDADSTSNDQMSSHEVKGRQNTCYMRPDPYQMKHVNSGHFWLPDYQPYWNDRSNLVVPKMHDSKTFPIDKWNLETEAENGDKTDVAQHMVNVAFPCGSRVIAQDGKFTCSSVMKF